MPTKPRKIPMRMCVGCREMKPKMELLRVVKPQDGEAHMDFTGRSPGRGAYVCRSVECLKRAETTRALERALEAKMSPEVFEKLAQQIEGGAQA